MVVLGRYPTMWMDFSQNVPLLLHEITREHINSSYHEQFIRMGDHFCKTVAGSLEEETNEDHLHNHPILGTLIHSTM